MVSFLSGTKYVIYPNIGGIVILVTSLIFWIIFVPKFHLVGIALGYTIGIIVGIGYQIIIAIVKIIIQGKGPISKPVNPLCNKASVKFKNPST